MRICILKVGLFLYIFSFQMTFQTALPGENIEQCVDAVSRSLFHCRAAR